jgi:hypothetical protein
VVAGISEHLYSRISKNIEPGEKVILPLNMTQGQTLFPRLFNYVREGVCAHFIILRSFFNSHGILFSNPIPLFCLQ